MNLYTIGHSNHPVDRLLSLLETHGIATLVDVRSRPYSRFHPQYNKRNLQGALPDLRIEYVYLGDALGGRPSDPTCYVQQDTSKANKEYLQAVNYTEVMTRSWFKEGIVKLLEIAAQRTTCILCSEWDPAFCHRHHLIAQYLLHEYPEISVFHILRDGSLMDAKTIQAGGGNPTPEQPSI